MSVQLAQITNWVILAVIIAVSIYFVGRDARRRALFWPETAAWVTVSIATFPIGFGLYYLLKRRSSQNPETGGAR